MSTYYYLLIALLLALMMGTVTLRYSVQFVRRARRMTWRHGAVITFVLLIFCLFADSVSFPLSSSISRMVMARFGDDGGFSGSSYGIGGFAPRSQAHLFLTLAILMIVDLLIAAMAYGVVIRIRGVDEEEGNGIGFLKGLMVASIQLSIGLIVVGTFVGIGIGAAMLNR